MVILSNGKVANWRKEVLDAEEGKAVIREVLRLYPDSSPELHETIDGLHIWAVVEKKSAKAVEARMTGEERKWTDKTAENLYYVVFHELDAQPFITGMEAGKIATKVEAAFKKAMEQHFK